jgi:hypothetical protein
MTSHAEKSISEDVCNSSNAPIGQLDQDVDVCIVGSGPDALTVLSALNEPFANLNPAAYNRAANNNNNHRRQKAKNDNTLKVCVVSPSAPAWLRDWEMRFAALDIKFLRSPASAHPDMFSAHGLREFAREQGRENELVDLGLKDTKELGGRNARLRDLDEGLFDVPTQALFVDFCRSLAAKLPHRCVQGRVVDIVRVANGSTADEDKEGDDDENPTTTSKTAVSRQHLLQVHVQQQDGRRGYVSARNVVLAIGSPGPSSVPQAICNGIPPQLVTHTNDVAELMALKKEAATEAATAAAAAVATSGAPGRVLVVGGGLSAVQAAIALASCGCDVVLASRRPLSWRHFDLPVPWLDRRTLNAKRHGFFSSSLEERPAFMQEVRGSGTVPPWYREKLSSSGVECVVAKVAKATYHMYRKKLKPGCHGEPSAAAAAPPPEPGAAAPAGAPVLHVTLEASDGSTREVQVDRVVLGTGSSADCLKLPLVQALQARWPVGVVCGLPAINQDLGWAPGLPVYVVGSLAALRVGPDAANLMGARRAAEVVAQNLGVYDRLEESTGNSVFTNAFSAFLGDSDGSSTEEEEVDVEEEGEEEEEEGGEEGDDEDDGEEREGF